MSYLVSLTGIVPPVRYDGSPWTGATISESAAQAGPFSTLTTVSFSSLDADPSNPQERSFTITDAALSSGWYEITFTDASGNSRAVAPVPYPQAAPTDPGYTSLTQVAARNAARTLTASSVPNIGQVQQFIMLSAGEINAILVNKGYQVPVNMASSPDAGQLLQSINTAGAYWMMEEAAPNSPNLDRAAAAWESAKKMLADSAFVLDAPQDQDRTEPRGPWVTFQPSGRHYDPTVAARCHDRDRSQPYLTRNMIF